MSKGSRYRVVQWGTGAMGASCLRAVLDRDGLELAGLFVHGDNKVGVDAGEIARRAPTGIVGVKDIDEIVNLDADVVIHASRLGADHEAYDDAFAKLLRSGKSILTINGNTFPQHWSERRRRYLNDACREGGASFMGVGLNPGFGAERLLLTAAEMCQTIETVRLDEVVLTSELKSPEYVFDRLAFGSEIGAVDMNGDDWGPAMTLNGLYEDVVAATADRLGWPLERITRHHRMLPAKEEMVVAAGVIKKGTACHIDWRWRGVVGGRERVFLSIAWAMSDEHLPRAADDLWRIQIEGTPCVSMSVDLARPLGRPGRTSAEQYALAALVINSIGHVVESEPGLLSPAVEPAISFS